MEKKIRRLEETVINQIAAGEVVENSASIVKELVENSLDAGAKRIGVEISQGGQQWIRIEDDGCGMSPEDALLCLERHATSKIQIFEDLESLQTMGFRGEALAAIAAVSHFQLKTSDGDKGTRVMAEGGLISAVEPCARNRGTTIEVRSLFYNVPARKKFQKSQAASTAQITRMIESLALAHPDVAFSLISQGTKIIEVKSRSSKERIEEILGKQELEVHFEQGGVSVWGFISSPIRAISNRSGQHFFLNRRSIFSPLISRAVKEGYGTRISETLHPSFVLFLQIAPDAVDVNVHPQKREVRFKEEGKIFRFFTDAVSRSFASPGFSEPISFEFPKMPFAFAEESLPLKMNISEEMPLPLPPLERGIAVYANYLFLEREGELFIVDLRAAHARVLFEAMEEKKEAPQSLLWPLEIELSREEEAEKDQIVEELSSLGIESRILGLKRLVVDALPRFLDSEQFPSFFKAWREGKTSLAAIDRFSRSTKKAYSLEEAQLLWQKSRGWLYDPLGNPISKAVKEIDMEGWMSR